MGNFGVSPRFTIREDFGPCPSRRERAYRLTEIPSNNPPVSFPNPGVVRLDFTPPFCLAFTVTLNDTPSYIFTALFPPLETDSAVLASLMVSSSEVIFMLNGQVVVFTTPGGFAQPENGFVQFQLCLTEGGQAMLFTNCNTGSPIVQPFVNNVDNNANIRQSLFVFLQNESTVVGGSFPVRSIIVVQVARTIFKRDNY